MVRPRWFWRKGKNPTMKIDAGVGDLKVEYVVVIIGEGDNKKVFSTNQNNRSPNISYANQQIVDTKNVGKQYMIFLQGYFTEGKNHTKLEEPVRFKINIYHDSDKLGIQEGQKRLDCYE